MVPGTVILLVWAAIGALLSYLVTGVVRRYAIEQQILDVPNERSSHSVSVPRGGGAAIAIVVLAGVAVLNLRGSLDARVATAMIGSIPVAVVGWLDDRRGVNAAVRVAVHALSAVWAVTWLGGFPTLRFGGANVELGLLGPVLAVVGITWLTNLYNFMDGIDGLAAGEGFVVSIAGAVGLEGLGQHGLALLAILIAGASWGFLVWNWTPARIFMGDVGSGFLGFVLAVVAVASELRGGPSLIAWIVLLGAFVTDATVTLSRRFVRGSRWYSAHREHAYQRIVRSGWSHSRASGFITGITAVTALCLMPSATLGKGELLVAGMAIALWQVLYWLVESRAPMDAAGSGTPDET